MIRVREFRESDLFPLADLYGHYAKNTICTYYCGEVTSEYMNSILRGIGHGCLVAVSKKETIGYTHISPGKRRNICEIAVYLKPNFVNGGTGSLLARHGEALAMELGYKVIQAAVCTENISSLALFESRSYKKTVFQLNAAKKFGRALHTQYLEKHLGKDLKI